MEPRKKKQSMVNWTEIVGIHPSYEGFFIFYFLFHVSGLHHHYQLCSTKYLTQNSVILQLRRDVKVGDWFSFEYYIEIRLYVAKVAPYRVPYFVPMRLFALDIIRQTLNVYQVHFVPTKK